jgi:hypothetical protein
MLGLKHSRDCHFEESLKLFQTFLFFVDLIIIKKLPHS